MRWASSTIILRNVSRHLTFFKIQFFEQVGPEIFCPMGYGEHEVAADSRIETLQLRYPKARFSIQLRWELFREAGVARVNLLNTATVPVDPVK